jgi:acetylglutamate kinase
MQEAIRKAEVLVEALPYIKRFHKKVFVIKYGGSILGEQNIRQSVLEDMVLLSYMGLRVALVHGGGPNISERMKTTGKKTDFVDGMRVTDEETLNIVTEELVKINDLVVKEIKDLGGKAKGMDASVNKVIQAAKKKARIDLGLVGEITDVDAQAILDGLKSETILVILPMGIGRDEKKYNINADEVACAVASSLKAEKLLFLTNVKGVMRNPADPESFLSTLTTAEAKALIKDNVIQQGMIPKVKACIDALEKGVKKCHMIDARISHGLLLEIFTDKGIGTEIVQ